MKQCKAMPEATLSAKNQIVIPREAREALNAKPGDKLLVVVRGDRVIVLQKPKSYRAAIRGLARELRMLCRPGPLKDSASLFKCQNRFGFHKQHAPTTSNIATKTRITPAFRRAGSTA